MNDTRVLSPHPPMVKREETEAMWSPTKNTSGDEWEVLAKPAKRLKVGTRVTFGDGLQLSLPEELDPWGCINIFEWGIS